jgi:hypothetical protein
MKDKDTSTEKPTLCYCGQEMFFDSDELTYLCRARFDGLHSPELNRQHMLNLERKRNAAISHGRIGGLKRAERLSPNDRSEIARKAARTRWNKGA